VLFAQSFALKTNAAGFSVVEKTNGVAVADYDLDGDLDVYFVARQQFADADPGTWNRFFRNEGNGNFSDITLESGIVTPPSVIEPNMMGSKFGAAWGDYNNDGLPDIYLTNLGINRLYRNQGDGTFTDVTAATGVSGNGVSSYSSALWWDYDIDGDLDLYVSAWQGQNIMYENNGDGTFLNVTDASGLGDTKATWTSTLIDANNDGLMDLYVINDFRARNKLYINLGNKQFQEDALAFGLHDNGDGMGVDVADYNNDGFFDIYVTNITNVAFYEETNPLFTNTGAGGFVNLADQMEVAEAGWGWGTEFFDCDHDGDLDLYVVNGFDFNGGEADTSNFFFDNAADFDSLYFVDKSLQTGSGGGADARGLAVFDYDNDGDLDLLVSNVKQKPYLYENQTATQNWLKIQLEGTVSNRSAIGAIVKVVANGQSFHEQHDGVNFLGQSLQPLHFGLGDAQIAEEIVIRWPSGGEERVFNVAVNRSIRIRENSGIVTGIGDPETLGSAPPETFRLIGNFPNPFNGETHIAFNIPRPGEMNLIISDVLGKEIRNIHQQFSTAGENEIKWDGTDNRGIPASSGIYLYQLIFEGVQQSGKMLYAR